MMRWVPIDDRSVIAALRRQARREGMAAGLSDRRLDEIAIVVTEALTNVLRYAGTGRALLNVNAEPGRRPLTLVVADNGPGIADLETLRRDGKSSSGSAGLGLGAIERLSDQFDIFSEKGGGTVLVAGFGEPNPGGMEGLTVEGLRVCHPAEQLCGDDWFLRIDGGAADIFLCDGLGHGRRANQAAQEVVATALSFNAPPAQTLARTSAAMTGHRGAVAAMLRLLPAQGKLTYSGLGNIATISFSGDGSRRFAVRDGRIGGAATEGFQEDRDIAPGSLYIMHSDGLRTLRDPQLPPSLLRRSPLLVAGWLMDRNFRGRDDASIVVAKVEAG